MAAELPWASVTIVTGYRGKPLVSTAPGTSTANATVVATACAAVFLLQTPSYQRWQRTGVRDNCHGWQFPRLSAAIATATKQLPRKSADVLGNCHSSNRGRPTAAISTVIRGRLRSLPRQSGNPQRVKHKI